MSRNDEQIKVVIGTAKYGRMGESLDGYQLLLEKLPQDKGTGKQVPRRVLLPGD